MPRCELTGKGPVVKNLVSHSNIKTKSTAHPNIQQKKVFSQSLGESISLKLAASTIRTMEHKGGFDPFILRQPDDVLSSQALRVKNRIRRKLGIKKVAQ
ncbi:MAG: 50S ribosomal protein L28 [Bdellovibrionaceae bacterium]|nr:50S ribosomal protein L28 [Pseudobdellovibrionaceae bacterium]